MGKRSKVQKAGPVISDPATIALVARIAEQLERAGDHPAVRGLASKARDLISGAPHRAVGASPNPGSLAKADRAADLLTDLARMRQRTDLDQTTRDRVEKAYRDLSTEYAHATAPRSTAVAEDVRKADAQQRAMMDSRHVAVGGDDIARKAEKLRKADPSISHYDSMLAALGDHEAQAAYLESVRGRAA